MRCVRVRGYDRRKDERGNVLDGTSILTDFRVDGSASETIEQLVTQKTHRQDGHFVQLGDMVTLDFDDPSLPPKVFETLDGIAVGDRIFRK
jgi:hypothetical protein